MSKDKEMLAMFLCYRRKDKEVRELYEAQKLQNQQSERALNDLKKEMQNNTDRYLAS